MAVEVSTRRHLLDLPAEIRMNIMEYVFEDRRSTSGFRHVDKLPGVVLDNNYSPPATLAPLLTCRQFCLDAQLLAMSRTLFVCSNLFVDLPTRLRALPTPHVQALRSIAFVADARHFRAIDDWSGAPFGVSTLSLDELSIVLHRSSCWHYLFDFTTDVVRLLRRLRGVQKLRVVRNGARVKGSFKTWYNRLIGLMLKVDHHERYLAPRPCLEDVWWFWSFDDAAQSFCLEARPPKTLVDEETYLRDVAPLIEELRVSVEGEEWNPDPRSRNGA